MKWGPQYWLISFYSNIYGKEKQTKKQFPHEILTQWNSWNVSKAYVTAQRWKSWSRSKEGQYFWEWAIFLGMGNIFGDRHYSRGSRHAAVLNLAASLKSLPCTSRVPTVCPGYRTLTKPVEKHIVREIYVACFICNCLLSCSIISDASASPVFSSRNILVGGLKYWQLLVKGSCRNYCDVFKNCSYFAIMSSGVCDFPTYLHYLT